MSGPLYPAARFHAAQIEGHFARHLADAGAASTAAGPDAGTIEALVDAAFWASLQREEGYPPAISLAFLPPERAVRPLLLADALPLGPRSLARLAPAVERPGIHLGVWRVAGELRVWGTTRAMPTFCFVLEVVAPGLLVVKHRLDEDSAKFRNVAVFEGEQVKLLRRGSAPALDDSRAARPAGPRVVRARADDDRRRPPARSPSPCARTSAGGRSWWCPPVPTPGASRSCARSPMRWTRRSRELADLVRGAAPAAHARSWPAWSGRSRASPRWTAPP